MHITDATEQRAVSRKEKRNSFAESAAAKTDDLESSPIFECVVMFAMYFSLADLGANKPRQRAGFFGLAVQRGLRCLQRSSRMLALIGGDKL